MWQTALACVWLPPSFLSPLVVVITLITLADQVVENPLKAEVRSGDEQQRINVVVRQATALKRTLLQVTGAPFLLLLAILPLVISTSKMYFVAGWIIKVPAGPIRFP
jgi:hypothetical protein